MPPSEPQPLTSRFWTISLALPFIIAAILGIALFISGRGPARLGAAPPGKPLDISFTVPGESAPRSLSQFRGRVVALTVWSDGCAECTAQVIALQQISERHSRNGLLCLVLSTGDQQSGSSLLEAHVFPNEAKTLPNARPATLILDREGRVRATFETRKTIDELNEAVMPLLGN